LDADWARANTVSAVTLPAVYLDVDPTTAHHRWALEVNTSRRVDHNARYQVT
jgi:hypothetical protein